MHECPRQENALLLAAGEFADLPAGQVGHADFRQRVVGRHALEFPRPPQPAEPAVSAHEYHVKRRRGEVPIDAAALRDVGDRALVGLVRLAVDQHPATDRRDEAEHRLDEGGFARAVGANDAHQHPRGDDEVDVPEHRLLAVGDRQVVDLDRVHGGDGGRGAHGWRYFAIVSMLCRTMPT